jgi:hypothetical protein
MKNCLKALVMILATGFALGTSAPNSQAQNYVLTNDDNATLNTVTVFHVTSKPFTMTQVSGSPFSTESHGSGEYYSGSVKNAISTKDCVFISDAAGVANDGTSDIAAFSANTEFQLTRVGNFITPNHDSGNPLGVGLAIHGNFLYAAYTTTNTIAVWQINGGCSLQYRTQAAATGLFGGITDGTAVSPNGKTLIVTYGDGSMGAYSIGTGGISLLNQIPAAGLADGGIPAGVFIDSLGKWAIFADYSEAGGPTEIDVAPITASGLGTSKEYGGPNGSLGTNNLISGNMNLSPDNTTLYVNGLNSGTVQSLAFDETTGAVTLIGACPESGTVTMTGHNTLWGYPGVIATIAATGKGAGIYVALAGLGLSGNSSYVDILTVGRQGCLLEQPSAPGAPVGADPNSPGMFSMSGVPRKNPLPK